jgi:hypothetical protein
MPAFPPDRKASEYDRTFSEYFNSTVDGNPNIKVNLSTKKWSPPNDTFAVKLRDFGQTPSQPGNDKY